MVKTMNRTTKKEKERTLKFYRCYVKASEIPQKEVRSYKSVNELDKQHQKDVNEFPVCWMFGHKTDDEIKEELKKSLGTTKVTDCCAGIAGEILLIADAPKYEAMWQNHAKEREIFNSNFDNFVSAIRHAMDNHEYGYTRRKEDALMALGKSYADLENDEFFKKAWNKAEKECIESYEAWERGEA